MLRSWNEPLYHLVTEVRGLQETPGTQESLGMPETLGTQQAPDGILTKAIEIEERNKQLAEGMEKIIEQVSSLLTLFVFPIKERSEPCEEEYILKYLTL